ncbi:MAG: hypothetical protein KDA28_04985, partial [Phycisphaerales bacterium]|nr:hypothetical protein [Phycisphaerales bacterium]
MTRSIHVLTLLVAILVSVARGDDPKARLERLLDGVRVEGVAPVAFRRTPDGTGAEAEFHLDGGVIHPVGVRPYDAAWLSDAWLRAPGLETLDDDLEIGPHSALLRFPEAGGFVVGYAHVGDDLVFAGAAHPDRPATDAESEQVIRLLRTMASRLEPGSVEAGEPKAIRTVPPPRDPRDVEPGSAVDPSTFGRLTPLAITRARMARLHEALRAYQVREGRMPAGAD